MGLTLCVRGPVWVRDMETWEIQHIVNGSNELINMGLLLGLMYYSSLCFSQGLIDKLNMSQFQCSLLDEWRDK